MAPAGLELQAVHLLGRAGEGLHAGDGDQRRAAVLRRQPPPAASRGSRRTTTASSTARCRCAAALAKSKNMVSIRILQAIGPAYAQEWVTRFGFEPDKHPAYLTMALGAGSVTPLQMAQAPTACSPTAATASIRVLVSTRHRRQGPRAARRPSRRCSTSRCACIDARNAFVMTSLLQEVTRMRHRGHGAGARSSAPTSTARPAPPTIRSTPGSPAGSPSMVAVVWIGYDKPRKLGDRETGGGLALPVWIDYMQQALKGVPVEEPPLPEGVRQRRRRVVLRRVRATAPASPAWAGRPVAAADARARTSARASSICSSAERHGAFSAAAWPLCSLRCLRQRRRRTRRSSRVSSQRPPT